MATLDLTTVVVVGGLVGLFVVALGYAQMVWFARHQQARDASTGRPRSQRWTWLAWGFAAVAALCVLRALTSRTLPDRPGFLVGEDLFSVRPRPGLVARYETNSADVHRDEVLIRFTGQDGEEGQLTVKSRRQLLQGELEIERARPLEFDPEIIRRLDAAKAALRDRDQRVKQLASERDGITRELTQQRLSLANRRFRIEQDDRAADRELKPLRASLKTEKDALRSQETLLKQGLVSQVEAARARDALSELEGHAGQLQDQRAILARERKEVATLREASEKNFALQISERTDELAKVTTELDASRKAVELATAALEQDRPRAVAQRDKRLRQIEVQIEENDWLLSGRGRQLTVEAPWDGRIGFREPSPSSAPADNGPLLVLYRPGKIGVTVHLESGEADATDANLRADVQLALSSDQPSPGGRPVIVPGTIAQRTLLPGGAADLRIACDPPDRVVRQLAMGGTVPVVARVRHGVASAASFWAGLAFATVALFFAGYGLVQRRGARPGAAEPPGWDRPATPEGVGPTPPGSPGAPRPAPALPSLARPRALPGDPDGRLALVLAIYGAVRGRLLGAVATETPAPGAPRAWNALPSRSPQPALPAAPAPVEAAPEQALRPDDLAYLRDLGSKLRAQVEGAALAPDHVREVREALTRSGYRAAALVGAGFGASVDKQAVERAAFNLLADAGSGALGSAARDCAEFLRVLRVIAPERMNGTLDRLRVELVAAALDVSQRDGSSSETAATVVQPLVEA